MIYVFEDCSLDIERRELRRGTNLVAVEPQVFDLLLFLIRNRTRVVSKDDLIAEVWNGRIVSELALYSRITAVRQAIGDTGEAQRLIRTVARKGLRFVGEVREDQPAVGGGVDKSSAARGTDSVDGGPTGRARAAAIDDHGLQHGRLHRPFGATRSRGSPRGRDSVSPMRARSGRVPRRLRRQTHGGRSSCQFWLSAGTRRRRRAGGKGRACRNRRRSRTEDRRYCQRVAGACRHRDGSRRGWRRD